VTKQLVALFVVVAASFSALAGGCASNPEPAPAPTIVPVPPNTFVQQWRAPLELKNDRITELHLRENALYAYTRNEVA